METYIRQIDLKEFEILHKECILRDFPLPEVRPYKDFLRLDRDKRLLINGLFRESERLLYASYLFSENGRCCMLDYFAVEPQFRGQGFGSLYLQMIRKEWLKNKELRAMIIEIESPAMAEDDIEKEKRIKRRDFYLKNGAVATDLHSFVYDVDFDLIYIPLSGNYTEEELASDYRKIYEHALSHNFSGHFFMK